MDIEVLWLIAAAGGGAFGAAIGSLNAFVFTGFTVLAGIAGIIAFPDAAGWFDAVAFGPVFGPHIAFAGGAAAAAYAAKRGYMEEGANGRDIVTPLLATRRVDVLFVGAIFGMIGYLFNQLYAAIPAIQANGADLGSTDTVAMAVATLGIIARLMFGVKSRNIFGPFGEKGGFFKNDEGAHWVEHQERWSETATVGLFSGLTFAFATVWMIQAFPDNEAVAGNAFLLGFGISAMSLLFLSLGQQMVVTHHMTIVAGLAAGLMYTVVDTSALVAVIIGTIFGVISALFGELASKGTNAHGDTHIDPPAVAIFVMTTVTFVVVAIVA